MVEPPFPQPLHERNARRLEATDRTGTNIPHALAEPGSASEVKGWGRTRVFAFTPCLSILEQAAHRMEEKA